MVISLPHCVSSLNLNMRVWFDTGNARANGLPTTVSLYLSKLTTILGCFMLYEIMVLMFLMDGFRNMIMPCYITERETSDPLNCTAFYWLLANRIAQHD